MEGEGDGGESHGGEVEGGKLRLSADWEFQSRERREERAPSMHRGGCGRKRRRLRRVNQGAGDYDEEYRRTSD